MEGVKAGPPKLSGAAWQKAVVAMWHASSSEQRAPYELLAVEDKKRYAIDLASLAPVTDAAS